jgi:hypothetical protein
MAGVLISLKMLGVPCAESGLSERPGLLSCRRISRTVEISDISGFGLTEAVEDQ